MGGKFFVEAVHKALKRMWLISKSQINFDSILPRFDWNFDVIYFISQGHIHPRFPSKLVLGPNLSPIPSPNAF
jgi:hypothetical protein